MQPNKIATEQSSEQWAGMDEWPARRIADELISAHLTAISCVGSVKGDLAEMGELVTDWLRAGGGRLVFCGAGSAGAQACLDGLELPATYGWPRDRLALMLAGGVSSFFDQGGLSEDDEALAANDMATLELSKDDVLIAVSASGNTPYTAKVVELARAKGLLTVAIVNNQQSKLQSLAKLSLVLETGAEAIAGSTRMAAASAQKIALNSLSTLVMTRLGYVYDNHMVQMRVSNKKLQARAVSMLCNITGCEEERAEHCLLESDQQIPLAALLVRGYSLQEAKQRLCECGGNLRSALQKV